MIGKNFNLESPQRQPEVVNEFLNKIAKAKFVLDRWQAILIVAHASTVNGELFRQTVIEARRELEVLHLATEVGRLDELYLFVTGLDGWSGVEQ